MKNTLIVAAFATLAVGALQADERGKIADLDGDGFISLAEFEASHDARVEERFTRADTNGDGLLSDDELKAAREARRDEHGRKGGKGKRHGRMNPEKMLSRLDADGSGGVSLQEFEGQRFAPDAAIFTSADIDGNGELDASELKAMMKARRAERRKVNADTDD